MFTRWPRPRRSIPGSTWRVSSAGVSRLRRNRCSRSSAVSSSKVPTPSMPALLTSTSTGPPSASMRSTSPPTCRGSVRSAAWAVPPSSAASWSMAAALRATSATRAPSAPKRRASASPMPRDPPVTSTRLPDSSIAPLPESPRMRQGRGRAPASTWGEAMKQLSGLDASFLYMETDSQFGHVSSLSIYDRPEGDPDYEPFSAWRGQIEARLHGLEPLRRRLRNVPLNLDHPFWTDDPDFDLDFHVRHTAVPPPGSDSQLAELVARIIGRPLDRRRPLWETYVIEGLPDDRFGILTKLHHATIDGASGAELLTLMLDADPAGDPIPLRVEPWKPERIPTDSEVIGRAVQNLVRKPGRALLLGVGTMREIGKATRNPAVVAAANQFRSTLRGPVGALLNIGRPREREGEQIGPAPARGAPRTPFNARITP